MAEVLESFLASNYMANTGRAYAEALVIFLACVVALWIFRKIVLMQLHLLSKRTKTDLDDYAVKILQGLGWPFLIQLAFNFSVRSLLLPAAFTKILDIALILLAVFYIAKSMQLVIRVAAEKYSYRQNKLDPNHDPSVIHLMTMLGGLVVWIIALLFILSNFGVNISALVAGLGIGGIAIAFALQNVLSDIFASFSIYFDKPFRVGDTIQVGTDTGKVKKVGIKSTRLETTQGQELIVSNKELTTTRINNFKKMERRRHVFSLTVKHGTPVEQAKKIPDAIKGFIAEQKNVELERVFLKDITERGLVFEASYFVKTADYDAFVQAQQNINYKILDYLDREQVG